MLVHISSNIIITCSRGVGVGSASAAKCSHNVDKATVVLHPSLGTTSLLLLLLLGINLKKGKGEKERDREINEAFRIRVARSTC